MKTSLHRFGPDRACGKGLRRPVAITSHARSCGAASVTARRATLFAATALCGALYAANVEAQPATNALPTGGAVTAGQSTIASSGANMTTQGTARTPINWNSYSVGANASVTYVQPNARAISLNLTASLTDGESMTGNGRFRFDHAGRPDTAVVNDGQITGREAGLAGSVASGVRNSGVINAALGRVELGGGNALILDLYSDQPANLAVNGHAAQNPVGIFRLLRSF
jgi:hypothetical protein